MSGAPAVVPIHAEATLLWRMTGLERLRRIARAQDLRMAERAGGRTIASWPS